MAPSVPTAETEIRAFAERVLWSPSLDDKHAPPGLLDDQDPGPALIGCPEPAREPGLRFQDIRGRAPFPRPSAIGEPGPAAAVLHAFANHELLAMEVMALFLLRQPQAPTAFRRGLARILAEEQIHFRLYLERMAALGLRFGELPVNRFLWDCVSDAADPTDLAARLGLTFEAANLDHALLWARAYRAVGDEETGAVLDRVYADEVGHVRHALHWFRRGQPDGADLWERYRDGLRLPLSAERAKGEPFSAEARRQAGFDEPFIEALRLYHHSKGRPPVVRWFNPDAEAQVALGSAEREPTGPALTLALDLDLLPVVLSARDDVVVLRRAPRPAFLSALADLGVHLPQLVVCPDLAEAAKALEGRKLGGVEPWGWSPLSARWAAPLLPAVVGAPAPGWSEARGELYQKGLAATLLRELCTAHQGDPHLDGPELAGEVCATLPEVHGALHRWRERGFETAVIKAAYGTAGRGARRVLGPLKAADEAWIEAALGPGPVVVEPWLDRVLDLSFHLDVNTDGTWRYKGVTRFFTTSGGRYRATWCAPLFQELDPSLTRLLHGDGQERRWLERVGKAVCDRVSRAAHARGHVGPVGVDALVHRHQGRLCLRPIVELNPRVSMGRVALHLMPRVSPGRAALFAVLSPGDLGRQPLGEFAARRAPPALESGRLTGGVCWLTDPLQATIFAAALAVGDDLAHCWRLLAP